VHFVGLHCIMFLHRRNNCPQTKNNTNEATRVTGQRKGRVAHRRTLSARRGSCPLPGCRCEIFRQHTPYCTLNMWDRQACEPGCTLLRDYSAHIVMREGCQ